MYKSYMTVPICCYYFSLYLFFGWQHVLVECCYNLGLKSYIVKLLEISCTGSYNDRQNCCIAYFEVFNASLHFKQQSMLRPFMNRFSYFANIIRKSFEKDVFERIG